jgi:hypothetical protein
MPFIEILEDQILDNPEGYAQMKSANTTRLNQGSNSGIQEFFRNLHKEEFNKLKRKKVEKS